MHLMYVVPLLFISPQVQPLVINPKSVTLSELYCAYDLSTFEWADGILSTLFKQSAESDKPDEKVRVHISLTKGTKVPTKSRIERRRFILSGGWHSAMCDAW